MEKIVFAEILDKKSNIRERVRLDTFPATIGRGYRNAVIIDDRQIDEEHLRLSLDEENRILVEDCGSVNGTYLSNSKERIRQYELFSGGEAVFRIGQTLLRLRDGDFAVAPAASIRQTGLGIAGRCLENKGIAFAIFLICFTANVLIEALKISKNSIGPELVMTSIGILFVLVLWAGFWALLGRVIVHSFRFLAHLGIVSLALLLSLFLEAGADYLEFFFTMTAFPVIVRTGGAAILVAYLLYAHLSIVSEMSLWKRLVPAILISAGLFGIFFLVDSMNDKEFSTTLAYSSVIKPVGRPLVRTVAPEEFFGSLGTLQEKITAMAAEKPKQ